MTPDALRAAIASARKRPRMYGATPMHAAAYLLGMIAGAAPDGAAVNAAWLDAYAAADPLHPTDDEVCDAAEATVAALWPQGDDAPALDLAAIEAREAAALAAVRERLRTESLDAVGVVSLKVAEQRAEDAVHLVAEVRRLRARRIADLAEHVGASARWGDRKVELLARIAELEASEKAMRAEFDAAEDLVGRQATLLLRTADALKGPPPPRSQHSAHDLPEVAAALRAEVERERAMRLDYESAIGFETACVGCAKQLDGHLALQERAEKAEAEVARLRAERSGSIAHRVAPSVAVDVDDDGDLVVVTRSEAEAFADAHPYAAGAIMGGVAHRSEGGDRGA